ncbi:MULTISPECIES: hypothetical protein [Bacillus]|uniref:Uncharacterized protein n=3 Tax=Bacillus cereus group TaxID=86661 RepID=A0AAP4V3Z4_BACTU|nr:MULTISPECIES: hypothetical protein [Bacillus]MEC0048152.1 hypothetical protein [Bacillus cereus]AFV21428.1 hypothetical protein BTB_502p00920 [Bacillus thuringiensis Bt407]EEM25538.1 hypothetical protein bthur0002_61810 [Bacillus thuringiensis Bt407]ERI01396.1 hypothetical protein BTCBT_002984 [Bacillus thuringiensis T01-328]MBN6708124.1 hypothetical protein [Bacillus thuringiensis]
MKKELNVPVILPEHEKVVVWVLHKINRNEFAEGQFAVDYMDCGTPNKRKLHDTEYVTMWDIYNSYTREQRDNINRAILTEMYRLTTDIKEEEIVTDGNRVGFAFTFDYNWKKRCFKLATSKSANLDWCSDCRIDEFQRVIQF